jgi:hypothetical protein
LKMPLTAHTYAYELVKLKFQARKVYLQKGGV